MDDSEEEEMGKDRKREWAIAIAILSFGLLTLFYFIPSQIEITEEYELKSLSPAFFPEVAAWIITGLSILHMVNLFRSGRTLKSETSALAMADEARVLTAMAIAVLYVLAFKYAGFIPASCLGLAAMFWLQGKRRPVPLILLSAGTAVLVYLIFYHLMKVRFPEGLWWR